METIFECRELSKSFGAAKSLDSVNISVQPGRVVGLLGPNGSGKTTLIKLANGLLTPTSGELFINSEHPGKNTHAWVSYLPDRPCLPEWMNTTKLMDMYGDFFKDFDRERAERMLRELGLDDKKTLKQMSKGMREKVQLVLTMSRRAKLYLLDEPIGGVDPATRDFILDTIIRNYDENASVIISTHLISDVETILDDVIFINDGRVVLQSSVDDIREQYGKSVDAYFREVFRCSAN